MPILPITRKNLRKLVCEAGEQGISRDNLESEFRIMKTERKLQNRLQDLIETERKAGFLELYNPAMDIYRQVNTNATTVPEVSNASV